MNENVIEFLRDEQIAHVTFSQGRWISKIKKLAEKYPDECKIVAENRDGSILAQLPVKWIRISKIERSLTDEQREELSQRFGRLRNQKRESD